MALMLKIVCFILGFACIWYTIGYHEVKGPIESRVNRNKNRFNLSCAISTTTTTKNQILLFNFFHFF